jgi:hypothetical protein
VGNALGRIRGKPEDGYIIVRWWNIMFQLIDNEWVTMVITLSESGMSACETAVKRMLVENMPAVRFAPSPGGATAW